MIADAVDADLDDQLAGFEEGGVFVREKLAFDHQRVSGDCVRNRSSFVDDMIQELSGDFVSLDPLGKVVGKILDEVLRLGHPVGISEVIYNHGVETQRRIGDGGQWCGRQETCKQNEKRSDTFHG